MTNWPIGRSHLAARGLKSTRRRLWTTMDLASDLAREGHRAGAPNIVRGLRRTKHFRAPVLVAREFELWAAL